MAVALAVTMRNARSSSAPHEPMRMDQGVICGHTRPDVGVTTLHYLCSELATVVLFIERPGR